MLNRIAIVSRPGNELEKIRTAFRNPLRYTVREFLSMQAVAHDLITFPMEILLMRVAAFEERHIDMVLRARRRFHLASIIVLAKKVSPLTRPKVAAIERFKLLQEPLEISDLTSIAEKFLKGDLAASRLHARARRTDAVQIIDQRGVSHHAQFLDFAQMGARLSFSGLQTFAPRESVQLIYGSSSEAGKQHRIEAKIVWASIGHGFGDQTRGLKRQLAGVRFIASY